MNRYRVPVPEEDRIRAGLVAQLVALRTGIAVEIGPQERIGLIASRARRLAVYLAHVGYGWPLERVGHAFGVNRTTASMACRWAEDMRDRADIDGMLDQLDQMLRDLTEAQTIDLAVAA